MYCQDFRLVYELVKISKKELTTFSFNIANMQKSLKLFQLRVHTLLPWGHYASASPSLSLFVLNLIY